MWAPRGRKKQLPGLSLWKKKSSCSCGVGVGKTSPRGDAGIRAPKNPGLFSFSRAQNPGFCQGLTRPMRRWSRRAAASCARCQASSSWLLGKATAATRCSERRSKGSPQKAAELCGEKREQKGRGAASGNPDGWVPSPVSPVPLSLPSAHGGPRSAPCAPGGGRGRAAAGGRTCEGDGRTNGHGRWTDGHSRRPRRRPAPNSPRMSPGTPGAHR